MSVTGCIALGVIVGVISGLVAAISFDHCRRRIGQPLREFPTGAVTALTGLVAVIAGGTATGSRWITIGDPPCADFYLIAVCLFMCGLGFPAYRHLLRGRARADAVGDTA